MDTLGFLPRHAHSFVSILFRHWRYNCIRNKKFDLFHNTPPLLAIKCKCVICFHSLILFLLQIESMKSK